MRHQVEEVWTTPDFHMDRAAQRELFRVVGYYHALQAGSSICMWVGRCGRPMERWRVDQVELHVQRVTLQDAGGIFYPARDGATDLERALLWAMEQEGAREPLDQLRMVNPRAAALETSYAAAGASCSNLTQLSRDVPPRTRVTPNYVRENAERVLRDSRARLIQRGVIREKSKLL